MSLELEMSQAFVVMRGADGGTKTAASTIYGRLAPLGETEIEDGMNSTVASHVLRVHIASDVTEADQLTSLGITYNVTGKANAAGADHHTKLTLKEIR